MWRNTARKKLCLCPDGWHTGIKYFNASLKHKRNRKFDFYTLKLIFISLIKTDSGISTPGFSTRENTAFVIHSVKYNQSDTEKDKYYLSHRPDGTEMLLKSQVIHPSFCP